MSITSFIGRRLHHRRGMTVIEITLMSAMSAALVLILVVVLRNVGLSVARTQVRNQMNNEAQIALNTMVPMLQRGIGNTTQICACGPNACSATCTPTDAFYSRIEFNAVDPHQVVASTYTFYWASNAVWMTAQTPLGPARAPRKLATNVMAMSINGNANDPSIVKVTLDFQAKAAFNQKERLLFPDVLVRMTGGR